MPDKEKTEEKAKKVTKGDLPAGLMTPVDFAKEVDVRPQIIYGYIRNSKDFPFDKDVKDSNGIVRGFAVKVKEAKSWLEAKDARKVERDAAKAEKEKAAAAKS